MNPGKKKRKKKQGEKLKKKKEIRSQGEIALWVLLAEKKQGWRGEEKGNLGMDLKDPRGRGKGGGMLWGGGVWGSGVRSPRKGAQGWAGSLDHPLLLPVSQTLPGTDPKRIILGMHREEWQG